MDTTTELIFKLFPSPSTYKNWANHVNFATLCPDLNEKEKIELKKAIQFLESELGTSFLKSTTDDHPLKPYITDKAKWRMQYLIQFAKTLKALKNPNSNYSELLKKINSSNECDSEAIPFIDISSSLLKERFSINLVPIQNGQKTPDLKIFHPVTQESIFAEVSTINESNEQLKAADNFDILMWKLSFNKINVPHSGRQLQPISEEEMPIILALIDKAKTEALSNRDTFTTLKNEKIDLIFSHPDEINKLIDWCEKNNRNMWFNGLSVNYNETARIKKNKRIKAKASQLPKDCAGLIYFIVNPLYFWQINFQETIREFNADMKRFPNLLGIVMYAHEINPIKDDIQMMQENHFFGKKMINEINCRTLLFVYNERFQLPIKKETKDLLYRSFLS